MEVKILEEILGKAGIYGGAFDKKTGKLVYMSPMLQEYFKDAKIGDDYKTAIPVHGLFGDGSENQKALMFDPCENGMWFNNFTTTMTTEDGNEIVLIYAIPTTMPDDFMIVKTEKI